MLRPDTDNLYLQRVNAVIDYIYGALDEDLSLERLAGVAGFSEYHFHRVFSAVVGETLNDFVARVRVERAAALMWASPELSILDAALTCGYQSASGFSRAFKRRFGISPRQWDRITPLEDSKIGQVPDAFPQYTVDKLQEVANIDGFDVRLIEVPAQRLAYLRVSDSYSDFQRILDAYDTLTQWYRRCVGEPGVPGTSTLYGMSMEDRHLTQISNVYFDWCLTLPDDWVGWPEHGISVRELPAFTAATIHMYGDLPKEDRAMQYLWWYWLPRSRYQPAPVPMMEIYRQMPEVLGWDCFDIDCALPVIGL
jgi:AraC family transcriptional regulator